jgi:putative peptide zinc metalloprotease protein
VAGVVAAAIALIPLPQRVWSPAELRPRGEETVYVSVAGRLEEILVKPDEEVSRGQKLAVLSSLELDLEIAELEGRKQQSESRLASLQRERFNDPAAALEIGTVSETLKSLAEQLERMRKDREELVLVAPRDGVILPAPAVPDRPDPGGRLPGWTGHSLDEKNLGATMTPGTVFCLVGDRQLFEAVMVVDQSEVEFLKRGQPVDLKLDAFASRTFSGTVDQIAETHIESGSERLSVKAGGGVPTKTDESGRETPISTSYEALMILDDAEGVFTPGMRGTARIKVGSRTVGQWLLRLLWQTFNFRM